MHINCMADEFEVPRRVAHDIARLVDPFKRPTAFKKELRDARLVYAAVKLKPCGPELKLNRAAGF